MRSTSRTRSRRRTLPALLAALLAVALLGAACGGDDEGGGGGAGGGETADASQCPVDALDDATGKAEITLWHGYVGLTSETIQKLADQYNAAQDKVVLSVEAQGTYEELLKKYSDALGDPDTLPDIILSEDTTTQFMIDSGEIVPAAACIAADPDTEATYDDILPAVTAAYTVQGDLWPAAFSVSTPVLYYNKGHFQQAGLDPEDPPATLDELRDAAEKLKAAGIAGVTQPLVVKADSWYVEHWNTGVKQALVNEGNGREALATESEFDNDTTVDTMTWLKAMYDDGLMKSVPYANVTDDYLAMASKSASMLIQTSTAITTINGIMEGSYKPEDLGVEGAIPQLDIGVGLFPGVEEAGQGQIGGSAWYMVGKGDTTVAASWDFLQWFLQPENQVVWTLEGSYLPILASAADNPTLRQDFESSRKGAWLETAYEGIADLDPDFPGPIIGPYNEFRTTVRAAMEDITLGGKGVAPTVEETNAKFQDALTAYAQEVGG